MTKINRRSGKELEDAGFVKMIPTKPMVVETSEYPPLCQIVAVGVIKSVEKKDLTRAKMVYQEMSFVMTMMNGFLLEMLLFRLCTEIISPVPNAFEELELKFDADVVVIQMGAAKKCLLLCIFSVDEKLKHLTLTQSVEHYLVITIMGKINPTTSSTTSTASPSLTVTEPRWY
ncbi:hypothetical protein V8G54_012504 [Vigna mungo]|uniref:Uncharacterized protein n=1 Tax=Vigna mungo TaxID=3915 RepID=A0AAQ3NT03_VIGMU